MQIRFIRLIDERFAGVPQTRKTLEMKEEIVQNLMEKFNDLVASGKSEEAAYHIAAASLGDIDDLIDELSDLDPPHAPEPDPAVFDGYYEAPVLDAEQLKNRRAAVTAFAIMLYILSPLPVIIMQNSMGVMLLFIIAACATGLLIYSGMTTKATPKEAAAGAAATERDMAKERKRAMRSLSSAFWCITVVIYFLISFYTNAWHITWVIFLIAVAISNVIKAFLDLNRRG